MLGKPTTYRALMSEDASAIRFMLVHIFADVRVHAGRTSSRNPILSKLKSFVRTDAVLRREQVQAEDHSTSASEHVFPGPLGLSPRAPSGYTKKRPMRSMDVATIRVSAILDCPRSGRDRFNWFGVDS